VVVDSTGFRGRMNAPEARVWGQPPLDRAVLWVV
jgi:hypothetical protein